MAREDPDLDSLAECLSLAPLGDRDGGTSAALLSGSGVDGAAARPTPSGKSLLCVPPVAAAGAPPPSVAFRADWDALQAISLTEAGAAKVAGSTSLGGGGGAGATAEPLRLACSPDARLLAAACDDGSLRCYDVARRSGGKVELTRRWTVRDAHSAGGTPAGPERAPPGRFEAGGSERGPVRSLEFAPSSAADDGAYALLLVDAARGTASAFDAACERPIDVLKNWDNGELFVTAAAWRPSEDSGSGLTMAVGSADGRIRIVTLSSITTGGIAESRDVPHPLQSAEEDDEDSPEWSCTHLHYLTNRDLCAGFCRVIATEGGGYVDEGSEETEESDDNAEHETRLLAGKFSEGGEAEEWEWEELEDVAPHFSVPRGGRHAFSTAYCSVPAPGVELLFVASNLCSDVGLLCRWRGGGGGGGGGRWEALELQEGSGMSTPTTPEDEFTFPTGLAVAASGKHTALLLGSTDGALGGFRLEHRDEAEFGTLTKSGVGIETIAEAAVPQTAAAPAPAPAPAPVPTPAPLPAPAQAAPASPGFSFASPTPFSGAASAAAAPAFGSGAAPPAFGSPSALSSKPTATAAGGFSFGATGSGASFGFPGGAAVPAFGAASTLGVVAAKKEEDEKVVTTEKAGTLGKSVFGGFGGGAVFGSGSSTPAFGGAAAAREGGVFGALAKGAPAGAPAFGTTSALGPPAKKEESMKDEPSPAGGALTAAFGSGKSVGAFGHPGGFGALAKSPSSAPGWGGFASSPSAKSALSAGGAPAFGASSGGTAVPPPFGAFAGTKPIAGIGRDAPGMAKPLFGAPPAEKKGEEGGKEKKADKAAEKEGAKEKEEPLEAPAEPAPSLAKGPPRAKEDDDKEGGSETSSLNTAEREELEEEKAEEQERADEVFSSLSADGETIPEDDFGVLIEAMGTTYCEEEHRRTIRKLCGTRKDGKVHRREFVEWYVDWLFGDGDDDDDKEERSVEEEEEPGEGTKEGARAAAKGGWGDAFKSSEDKPGSWKCDVCMVKNGPDVVKCAACETARPGHNDQAKARAEAEAAGAIGAGGFTFGGPPAGTGAGAASGKVSIGAGGFSFGGPAKKDDGEAPGADKGSEAASGFSFGALSIGGGSATPSAVGGFSFGAPKATEKEKQDAKRDAKKDEAAAKEKKDEEKKAAAPTAAFPPLSAKAPTPFGGAAAKAPSVPMPPMSTKAPTPFGGAAAKAPSAPMPPMSAKAPTPFGGVAAKTPSAPMPPMSAKAPTPFGGVAAKAPSAPMPPLSLKAPTPFGAGAAKAPSAPMPPMSAKVPTPFGAAAAKAPSAPMPPMSAKTPMPFGGAAAKAPSAPMPPLSAKAPTPFGGAAAKAPSAPMPPMSGKAPTPFGGAAAKATSAPMPPMSAKAPTPFGEVTAKAPSAPMPPMSSQAPTPFGSTMSAKAPSAPMPPMSAKAPTPFGGGVAAKAPSAPMPPMSAKAPTPFGGAAAKAPSAPMPQMSAKAPTPFGAQPKVADKASGKGPAPAPSSGFSFGSATPLGGGSAAPTFGSGAAVPSFGSGGVGGGGFGAPAKSPSSTPGWGGFGAPATSPGAAGAPSPFGAFGGAESTAALGRDAPGMVKPLFGASTSAEEKGGGAGAGGGGATNRGGSPEAPASAPPAREPHRTKDSEEGEDEEEEASSEASSLNTADREELEEERADETNRAHEVFSSLSTDGDSIPGEDFGVLMEAMGTTYCEEEHRRTVRNLAGTDGKVHRDMFVEWYIDWLFGEGDDDEEGYSEEEESPGEGSKETAPAKAGWGDAFKSSEDEPGSWKCEVCMVRNGPDAMKCAACETVRPGYEDEAEAEAADGGGAAAGGIGAGGFTFGAPPAGAGAGKERAEASAGTGGFSFGAPSKKDDGKASAGAGGFSFGATAAAEVKKGEQASTGAGGFSFGAPAAEAKKDGKATGGFSFGALSLGGGTPAPSSTGGFSFGAHKAAEEKKDAKKNEGKATLPPLSSKIGTTSEDIDHLAECLALTPLGDGTSTILAGSFVDGTAARPTSGGKTLVCAPPCAFDGSGSLPSIAFRADGSVLQAVQLTDSGASIAGWTHLAPSAVHIAASSDARLLAVACDDGSLRCFDVTSANGSVTVSGRWTVRDAHSDGGAPVDEEREMDRFETGASEGGPVRSLAFAPSSDGTYALLLADAARGSVSVFDAASGSPRDVLKSWSGDKIFVTAAAWGHSGGAGKDLTLAAGSADGSVWELLLSDLATGVVAESRALAHPLVNGSDEDDEDSPDWSCTHLHYVTHQDLCAGFCRVIATEEDGYGDEEDEDDSAEHETRLIVGNFSGGGENAQWSEVEDVAPHFSVPRGGRHAFFTAYSSPAPGVELLFVTSNLCSDVGLLCRLNVGDWQTLDVQEGNGAGTPTTPDDEFTFPTGLAVGACGDRTGLLLGGTDGSLGGFKLEHRDREKFGALAEKGVRLESLGSEVLPKSAATSFGGVATRAPAVPIPPAKAKVSATAPSAVFPPMSKAAPTPFGGLAGMAPAPSVRVAPTTSGGFSFGAPKATEETKVTKPDATAEKKEERKKVAAAPPAAFPPLSAKPPTPFGAAAAKAPAPAPSAAFPPMSKAAPTPFGGGLAGKAPSPAVQVAPTATGGFSFGDAKVTEERRRKVPAAAPAAAFPPLSAKPPTPFGAATAAAKASAPAPSAAFPPMSKTAPTPFGGGLAGKAPARPAPDAAVPPMIGKAPTAFDTKRITEPSLAVPKASSFGMGAMQQSMALPTPPPAGAAVPQKATAVVPAPSVVEKPKVVEHVAASEYEAQMWKAVGEFQTSLRSLRERKSECALLDDKSVAADFESEVEDLVADCEKIRSDSMLTDEQMQEQKQRAVLMLSRRDDIERQVQESRRLIDEQQGERIGADGNLLKDQPLDVESENIRRTIAAKALATQKFMGDMQERVRLMKKLFDVKVDEGGNESFLDRIGRSGYSPRRRRREEDAAIEANKALFDALKKGYERTGQVEKTLDQLQAKVEQLKDNFGGSDSEGQQAQSPKVGGSASRTPGKRQARIAPLPLKFASPSASKKQSTATSPLDSKAISSLQSSIETAVRKMGESAASVPVKRFSRRRIVTNAKPLGSSAGATNWRSRTGRSQLMSPDLMLQSASRGMGYQSPPSSASKKSLFASPPPATRQAEWDVISNVDQAKLDAISLQLPTTIKVIDASNIAREALAPYGTTPEKTAEASRTRLRGEAALRQPQKKPEPTKVSRPAAAQKSSAAPFPPMSSKAPTPPSQKGLASTKPKSTVAFPPMATKAPTPFSQTSAKAKSKDKVEAQKKEIAPAFDLKAKAPSSLFGSPPAKAEDKKSSVKPATEADKADTGSKLSALGGFGGLVDALSGSKDTESTTDKTSTAPLGLSGLFGAPKVTAGPAAGTSPSVATPSAGEQDYNKVLTEFYQKYNPTKLGEVAQTLEKYKGREPEMFDKLARKYSVANPLSEAAKGSSQATPSPSEYHSILTEFYKKHSPAKVPEAARHLERYKGREAEMFAKLAKKYNSPNPLETASKPAQQQPEASSMSLGGMGTSLFSSDAAPSESSFPSAPGPAASPFGAPAHAPVSSSSPFGGAPAPGPGPAPAPAPSAFGGGAGATNQSPFKSTPTPFGAPKVAPSPFGQQAGAPATPFGAAPSPTPFGQAPAPVSSPSPFGSTMGAAPAPSSSGAFGGKNPRDILVDFYQKRNPTKVAEVDKLLTKYAGQEALLFRNLAKKYNLDPAVFGVTAMPASAPPAASSFGTQPGGMASGGGFGQTSALGGGMGGGVPSSPTPFGKPSALGGGASAFGSSAGGAGGSGFGSSAGTGTTPGFGGLAAAGGGPSGFGAGAAGGFGGAPGGGGGFGVAGTTGGFGTAAGGGGFGAMGGGGAGFGSPGGFGGGMGAPSPFGAPRR